MESCANANRRVRRSAAVIAVVVAAVPPAALDEVPAEPVVAELAHAAPNTLKATNGAGMRRTVTGVKFGVEEN